MTFGCSVPVICLVWQRSLRCRRILRSEMPDAPSPNQAMLWTTRCLVSAVGFLMSSHPGHVTLDDSLLSAAGATTEVLDAQCTSGMSQNAWFGSQSWKKQFLDSHVTALHLLDTLTIVSMFGVFVCYLVVLELCSTSIQPRSREFSARRSHISLMR